MLPGYHTNVATSLEQAPEILGYSGHTRTSINNIDITINNKSSGRLHIVYVTTIGGSGNIVNTPSGYTRLNSSTTSGSSVGHTLISKILTGSESSTLNITSVSATYWACISITFDDTYTIDSKSDGSAMVTNTNTTGTIPISYVNYNIGITKNAMWLAFLSQGDNNGLKENAAVPSNYAEINTTESPLVRSRIFSRILPASSEQPPDHTNTTGVNGYYRTIVAAVYK